MHPVIEMLSLQPLEKAIVNILLRSKAASSQASIIAALPDLPSQASVSRAMASLIAKGILDRTGATRGSKFQLTPHADRFARPPQLRSQVLYDPERIRGYQPNITTWLPEDVRLRFIASASTVEHHLDASTYSQQIAERFLIDLAWASSHLEGNTYDYLSTEILIKYGDSAEGHERNDAAMILNHKAAIGRILEVVGSPIVDAMDTFSLHMMMMRDLMDPIDIGRIRRGAVQLASSSYKPTSNSVDLEYDLSLALSKARLINDPFEASFFLLSSLSYLQAFGDGNKRMGRLLANQPLLNAGLPPMSFVGIDQKSYILGLIMFYELGETRLLSEALVASYELVAPTYEAAVKLQRIPKSIELRERVRIAECVREVVRNGADGYAIEQVFPEQSAENKEALEGIVKELIAALIPPACVLYGLTASEIEAFLASDMPSPG